MVILKPKSSNSNNNSNADNTRKRCIDNDNDKSLNNNIYSKKQKIINFNNINLNNMLPLESNKTNIINNIVLPIINLESIDECMKKTVKISKSSRVQYFLQHGYILKGNDVKKIDGYIKFKNDVSNDFNNIGKDNSNNRHTRSAGRAISQENNEHFTSRFFNYGNPSLKYEENFMDNNDFFPQDAFFGLGMVQVSQCNHKYWNNNIDKFINYFTKKYVHIYDEYKNLIPYSLCTLRYNDSKKNNRPYHNDPPAYKAIVGFNFEGTATFKLEKYKDFDNCDHLEQIYNINDDDTYIMLGIDTCKYRKHAVDGCSKDRFVPLIKYVDKDEFIQKIKESPKFKDIKNGINIENKIKALENAVKILVNNISIS